MSPRMPLPVEIGSVADPALVIVWSDGHRSTYSWIALRRQCPCAACAGEWGDRPPRRRPADLPSDIRAWSIARVGAYALRFDWSDGHNTGLYTFASLRNDLCECEECRARRGPQAGQ
jgi:DUF971 family protein